MAVRPVTVTVTPVPDLTIGPGLIVTVQVPVAGNPFNTTLPVATEHVGWVIVPTVGAVGTAGAALIVKADDGDEVHPTELVTTAV